MRHRSATDVAGSSAARLALAFVALLGASVQAQITVVNMIPASWAAEKTQNSEPSLAINGKNSAFVAASSFTSGLHFCRYSTNAPVFISNNNGNDWALACILPTASTRWPQDMTVSISSDATALYATTLDFYRADDGLLRMVSRLFGWSPNASLNVAFKANVPGGNIFLSIPPRTTLYSRGHTDQPFGRTPPDGGGGRRVLMLGENRAVEGVAGDICVRTIAAFSTDPWLTPPKAECLGEERPATTATQTIPASRSAMAGTAAYIVAYRPVLEGNANDVVVYRRGATKFDALKDLPATGSDPASTLAEDCARHDGRPGLRVVTCVPYADVSAVDGDGDFGQERRIMMDLGIAVHPTDRHVVVVAWAKRSSTMPTRTELHFATSQDGGIGWNQSPWSVDNATNPTLAVASDGAIGVLFQELVIEGGVDHWKTQFAISTDNLATTPTVSLLASVVALDPHKATDPYLGDYMRLEAVGRNFYGVFAASNNLKTGSFPTLCPAATCKRQRPYNAAGLPIDRNGNLVAPSIDPFFVRVIR